MSTALAEVSTPAKRGRFFYSLVTIKVEEKVYQVRKDRLENHSQYFQEYFVSAKDKGSDEGSKENPIELRGCTRPEFDTFLAFLTSQTALSSPLEFVKEQWVTILKLGTLWAMHSARSKAIAELKSLRLTATERATIGMQYGVSEFFIGGCTDLARSGFDESEIDTLGNSMGYAILARLLLVRSMAREKDVALPLEGLKCLHCSARLSTVQKSELVPSEETPTPSAAPSNSDTASNSGASGWAFPPSELPSMPPTPYHYVHSGSVNQYTPGPSSHPSQPTYCIDTRYLTSQLAHAVPKSPKTSFTLKLSCPNVGCRAVPTPNGVTVDEVNLNFDKDVRAMVLQVFSEEISSMS